MVVLQEGLQQSPLDRHFHSGEETGLAGEELFYLELLDVVGS